MSIRFLSLLIFTFFSNFTYSQTCCSGGVPISNNIGLEILEKGALLVGVSYDYNKLETLKEGRTVLNDNSRRRITQSVLVNLGYNLTDDWTIEALLSWVNQEREIFSNFGNSINQTKGVGDWILLSSYRYLNKEDLQVSSGLGIKLPTGSHELTDERGIVLNADLQPGSNSLDYIFITSLSKSFSFRRSLNLSSRVVLRFTGVNKEYQKINSYEFGDEIQFFLGVSDQFLIFKELFSTGLTLKYRKANQDIINNNKIPNTGGEWLFVVPNISYLLNKNFALRFNVEVPIYSKLTGVQLTPDYRANIGVVYKLFKNKKIM